MKKLNRMLIRGTNWALAGLLTACGFSGCDILGPAEYGSPEADFVIKGKVVNKKDGQPIKGIRVGFIPVNRFGVMYGVIQTDYKFSLSDGKGEFELSEKDYNLQNDEDNTVSVYIEDIDGVENSGKFKSDTLHIDFRQGEHSPGKGNWYQGKYTVDVKNVELEEDLTQTENQE